MSRIRNEFALSDTAVKCGRVMFYIVGGSIAAVPAALAAGGIAITSLIEWIVLLSGLER